MSLLPNELARWKNGQLELRPQPLRVRWTFDDLVSVDGHALRATLSCSVQGLADPTERRMLQEVLLLWRSSITDETVVEHFSPALRATGKNVAAGKSVDELLSDAGRLALAEAFRAAAKPVAFACGVELFPPFHVDTESETLERQRMSSMQRTLAEQHAAGQAKHLQRSFELYQQFDSIRRSAPELSAGDVLQRVSPADQSSLLQTLLLAGAAQERERRPSDLWLVAGSSLGRVEHADETARLALTPLPQTLGPLRSVQPAEVGGSRVLLVGARRGFFLVPRDRPADAVAYADPGLDSPLGFSRVVYWPDADAFVACHGDGGIVQWSREEPGRPAQAARTADLRPAEAAPPQPMPSYAQTAGGGSILASMAGGANGSPRAAGPRHLQVLDERRIVFGLGAELRGLGRDGPFDIPGQTGADVVAILPDERRLCVVYEDGTVCVRDRSSLQVVSRERKTGRVRAAAALPWLGEMRLLLAGDDGPVQCVGFDDPLVTQYATSHRGLRLLAGSAPLVAAVSPDRQKLILWNSWDGRKPAAEVAVSAVAKHRIADVAFG
jgi:hypothetical protein